MDAAQSRASTDGCVIGDTHNFRIPAKRSGQVNYEGLALWNVHINEARTAINTSPAGQFIIDSKLGHIDS
jgi:hypothetical protein